ncbi:MAG: sodium:calcium antiporter [Chloroflexi bacterium]|nr:sodium:calcium antiporter [Chloroflexota bacterium]
MIWVEFAVSAILIVIAAIKLAEYGDVIAIRTRLGGLFIGTLLMAGATSLPELLTSINAIDQNVPNLMVGNIYGSSMFNMALLGILGLIHRRSGILRRVATTHALTASLAILLTGASIFFLEAKLGVTLGWLGVDSLVVIGIYLAGTNIIHQGNKGAAPPPEPSEQELEELIPLSRAGFGFAIATLALVVITPVLVSSSAGIAEETGISTGFVGVALVGIVTSLPEVVTTIAAARLGAVDLAVGNLFGSNVFNIFILGITDIFYLDGSFFELISPVMSLSGMIALLMTTVALIGNQARVHYRFLGVDSDALIILVIYVLGLYFLYSEGLVG